MNLGLRVGLGTQTVVSGDPYDMPASLPTPLLWYNPAKGGDGATLTDFGSLGVDAAQGTGAKQPTLNATGLNGRPTLDFDGTDDCMFTASIDLTSHQTITELLVWYPNVSTTDGFITVFGATNSISAGSYSVGQNLVATDDVFVSAKSTTGSQRNAGYKSVSQAVRVAAVTRDLTQTDRALELVLYLDGVAQTLVMLSGGEAGSGTFANAPLSIGAQGAAGSANTWANIKFAEKALFSGILTTDQITAWSNSRMALYVA